MTRQKPIFISIPNPCSENWDQMKEQHNGKLCAQCDKKVVDFTGFSDTDLFNYLRSHLGSCGRFIEDQLQRPVAPLTHQKRSWANLYQVAAGLLTFISLKGFANVPPNIHPGIQQHYTLKGPGDLITYDSAINPQKNDAPIIRGKLTDKTGDPLIGAGVTGMGYR